MTNSSGANAVLAILERLFDAFNRHDLDAIMERFAEDCTLEMPRGPDPWGQRFVGKVQVREGLAGRFAGIPDVHYGQERHWACADEFGVSEWTLSGTTATGTAVNVRGTDHYTIRDGLVIRKNSFWKIVE